MRSHRAGPDRQPLRDRLVVEAGDYEPQHLALALCELAQQLLPLTILALTLELLTGALSLANDQAGQLLGGDEHLAGGGQANGGYQLGRRLGLLQEIAGCPCLDRGQERLLTLVGTEEHDDRVRTLRPQSGGSLRPRAVG